MNKISVCNVEISNPQKIVFDGEKITKFEVVKYYKKVAKRMLPFLNDRLISVIRCHSGKTSCFFKKHPNVENELIKKFYVDKNEEPYFYVDSTKGVVFQAQMDTIEFHIWASKTKKIEMPDIMTFDLDPDKNVSLQRLRNAVKLLKNSLDELDLKSYLKTSGGKGYHVLIPFAKTKNFKTFVAFAKNIATFLENKYPNIFTANSRKEQRKNKIFVDYLRNSKGATCVCPYSLRARDNAPISFPIPWNALNKIAPNEINIKNVDKFLKRKNPWSDFFFNNQKLV